MSTTYTLQADGTSQTVYAYEPYTIQLGAGLTQADVQWVWQAGSTLDSGRYALELTEGRGELLLPCLPSTYGERPDAPQGLDRILTADGQNISASLRQALLTQVRQVSVAVGTSGDDLLYSYGTSPSFPNRSNATRGREGNDTLVAMLSTEVYNTLEGGAGNDTYLVNGDWGLAAITDVEGSNVVRFGAEWQPEDLSWQRQSDGSMVVTAALKQPIPGDVTYLNSLVISNFDATDPAVRPQDLRFEFASQPGVVLMADEVRARLTDFTQADAERIVNATVKPMTQGSPGKNNLWGADLRGGQGDDRLVVQPQGGQSIVHYGLGDGNDTVLAFGADVAVVLDAGITPGMVRVQLGNAADGSLGDDQVRIGFVGRLGGIAATGVPALRFADGTVWTAQQVFDRALSTPVLMGSPLQGEKFDLSTLTASLDIRGNSGDDTLSAGSGNDTIDGGVGNANFILAGAGNDLIRARATYDQVSPGEGNDTIDAYGVGGLFDVRGQGQDLVVIHGSAVPTVKLSKDSTDRIEYQASADAHGTLRLLLSADIERGSVVVDRNSGSFVKLISKPDGAVIAELDPALSYRVYFESDRQEGVPLDQLPALLPGAVGSFVQGTAGSDKLVGNTSLATVMLGLGGDDTMNASPANVTLPSVVMDGGAGNDLLQGSGQADSLIGGKGNDTLLGQGGDDTLDGGSGNDRLDGGAGADLYRISGTQYGSYVGDVSIIDYSGEDTIVADNTDTIEFATPVTLDRLAVQVVNGQVNLGMYASYPIGAFNITLDSGQDWSGLTLRDVNGNTFRGSDLIDRAVQQVRAVRNDVNTELTGFFGKDSMYGMGGNDTLRGLGGNDTLNGADGDDLLSGDDGNDVLSNSYGTDTLVGGAGADVYEIYLVGGTNVIRADAQDTIKLDCLRSGLSIGRLDASGNVQLTLTDPSRPATQTLSIEQASTLAGLTLKFSDGSTLAWTDVLAEATKPLSFTIVGTEDDDGLSPASIQDTNNYLIQGLGGIDYLSGAQGQDTLEGGTGSDTLFGRGGNDLLKGGADGEADYLDGGTGNDTVWGQDKGDTLIGGQGADRIVLADQYDTSSANIAYTVIADASDTIELNEAYFKAPRGRLVQRSSRLDLELQGGTGSNLATINFQNASRLTQTVLTNASGSKTFNLGDIFAMFQSSGIFYEGTAGNDDLLGGSTDDTLLGKAGNDTLTGGAGNDLLGGDDGDDVVYGGDGSDTLSGSSGNDTLVGGAGADLYKIFVALGRDVIRADAQDTVDLAYQRSGLSIGRLDSLGNVLLTLADSATQSTQTLSIEQASTLAGLTLKFKDGSTLAWADVLAEATKPLNLTLNGTTGADSLQGQDANDTLNGFAGKDTLLGNLGNDVLDGGEGDDLLIGGGGSDTFVFGLNGAVQLNGTDTVVADVTDTLEFRGPVNFNQVEFLRDVDGLKMSYVTQDTLKSIQAWIDVGQDTNLGSLTLKSGSDVRTLSQLLKSQITTQYAVPARASIVGGEGRDLIYGGADAAVIDGGLGDDTLVAQGAGDSLTGGAGADTFRIAKGCLGTQVQADGLDTIQLEFSRTQLAIQHINASGGVTVNLGGTATAPDASFSIASPTGIDTLKLKFSDGSLMSWKDVLAEATKPLPPANLTLTGTAKADTLKGGAGNDTLTGLAGNDSLSGAAGNDSLDGGVGADTLQGGAGNDTLVGATGNDTYLFAKGDGQDRIVDTDSTLFNSDVLKISGAATNQLWFKRTGNDLEIDILGTQDKAFVQDWFKGSANQVEKITAADSGKSLSVSKVNSLVSAMASFQIDPSASSTLPSNTPAAITKLVTSSWA